jgi:DNA-binding transcriptional ArsR family regulator
MVNIPLPLRPVSPGGEVAPEDTEVRLDLVFAALSDPIRRQILERLDGQALLVSELAEPFDISLQGVSRHIQVLVRAGLIQQERSG